MNIIFRLSLSLREKTIFFLKTMLTIDFGAEVHGIITFIVQMHTFQIRKVKDFQK